MRTFMIVCAIMLLCVFSPGVTESFVVPMNEQINLGYTYNSQSPGGDAIYPAFNIDTMTIFGGAGGYTRHNLDTVPGGWWYQYVDFNLAGITTPGIGIDLSGAGATISFETRFYQDAITNTNPYGDAPVFFRMYTYAADGNAYLGHRDFGIVYGPTGELYYPTWTTITIDSSNPYTDGGTFDITNVSRIRFYGTDWSGGGDDFVDFRNLAINAGTAVPEPTTMLLIGISLAGLAGISRKLHF